MKTYYGSCWWVTQKKKHMALVFITITMILLQMKGSVGCVESERMGLLQLKSYLKSVMNDTEESILESWSHDDPNSDCCHWEGVKCSDSIGGHVVDLSLDRINNGQNTDCHLNLSLLHSFPQLKTFTFAFNRFSNFFDPIHGYKSLQRLQNLETLDLYRNYLNNSVLPFLSAARSLVTLDLGYNRLSGVFPPPELTDMPELRVLNLDSNGFSFFSVQGFKKKMKLKELDLARNNFSDNTRLQDNRISGNLPLWIGRMSTLAELYMRGNKLEGHFPLQLQNLQTLGVIDISHNRLYGSIPSNVYLPPEITELRLQNNEFMGSIPKSLFKIEGVLDLRNNNFSGKIPNMLDKGSYLRVLLLRNNSLESHIPEEICQLSKVNIMDLSHNNFKGVIPSCLAHMSFGAENPFPGFDLDNFEIYDELWSNFTYASHLSLRHPNTEHVIGRLPSSAVDLVTKRRYETYQGNIINDMFELDLSNNQLTGEIPVELGDLKNLKSLNLSSNQLTGSIPDSLSKLKNLESLDLSYNSIDGKIPPQLADLDSLGDFNVSYNNLSGEIPFKGHLVTFNEMNYIGNDRLCGMPTNISCNPTRDRELSTKGEEEESEDMIIDMVWFLWTCGAVYISTLLALFAFLCIDTRWSREWFYRVDLVVHHLQRFLSN